MGGSSEVLALEWKAGKCTARASIAGMIFCGVAASKRSDSACCKSTYKYMFISSGNNEPGRHGLWRA
jgi:hypothetical protein